LQVSAKTRRKQFLLEILSPKERKSMSNGQNNEENDSLRFSTNEKGNFQKTSTEFHLELLNEAKICFPQASVSNKKKFYEFAMCFS
jgi:hypothetical protein